MMPPYRLLGAALLQVSLLFAPVAATSTPGPAADSLLETATEAYLWGYPLVYNMDTFEHFLTGESPRFGAVRCNHFSHARALQGPEDQFVSPNVDLLFSLALCDLVANAIHRYAISSTTPGLRYNADGSLTLYLQAGNPGPDKVSNWLPTPAGDFRPALSIYEPQPEALAPTYTLPPIRRLD